MTSVNSMDDEEKADNNEKTTRKADDDNEAEASEDDEEDNNAIIRQSVDDNRAEASDAKPPPQSPPERQLSASEEATLSSSGRCSAPWWLKWMECPFAVTEPSTGRKLEEATAWSMDASARAPINQAGAFVGTALLTLATVDAGCKQLATCENTIYGLRPSSLLTLTSVITGVVAAISMPVFGAIVDHTRHRKLVGSLSAFIIVAITGVQISISESNWLIILVLEAIGGFTLLVHVTAVLAYLPDLTTNESDLAHYTTHFNLRQYTFQTLYVGILAIIGAIRGVDNTLDGTIRTARVSLLLALVFSAPLFAYAWTFLFRKRDALSKVPEGSNLLTAGFVQVGRTCSRIWSRYHALRWFMISLLWSPEAGAGTAFSIVLTFMAIYLEMSAQQVVYTFLIVLVAHLPGSLVAKWSCLRFNPLVSYRGALVLLVITIASACAVLTGPERRNLIYIFAVLWGIAFGWMYPSQRVLFCTLIPKKQETELMGLFVFCGNIIAWLPPLIFTAMNERGVDMRWGLSLNAYFSALAFLCTLPMGQYKMAIAQVVERGESHELQRPQSQP